MSTIRQISSKLGVVQYFISPKIISFTRWPDIVKPTLKKIFAEGPNSKNMWELYLKVGDYGDGELYVSSNAVTRSRYWPFRLTFANAINLLLLNSVALY